MIKEVNKQYLYHAMWKKQFLICKKEGKLHSHSTFESNGNNTQHRRFKGISMSRNLNVCINFMENQIKEFQNEWQNVSPLAKMHVNFSDNEDENYVDASSDLSYVILVFDRNKLKQNHKIISHSYLAGRERHLYGDEQEEVVVGNIPNFMDYVVNIIEYDNNINPNTLKSKENVYESYIKAEKGNIYYTKNSDMFLSMVKSIFISKNIPVRVYYDTIKKIYVFGNAFDYIHADLANGMKYYSKIYAVDEMRANISYLKQNCALFQVLPNDDFKKYDMGDGYSSGWFLKLDDLLFACRNKEYEKVRDNVPLFKDHIGEWMDVQYYLSKKSNQLNENSFSDKLFIIKELLNYDYVTVDFYFFSQSIVLYGNGDANNDYKFEFNSDDFGMICRSLLYYFEARDKILDKNVNKKLLLNKVEDKLKNYSNSTISKEMVKGILNKYYNSNDVEKLINKTLNESYTPDWIQDLMEEYSCYEILEMFRNGENLWNNLIQPEPYKKALSEFVKYGELLHFPKDKVFDWFKIIVTNTIKMTSMSYLAGHEGGFPVDDVKDFLGDDDLPNDFSVLSNILEEKGFYAWSKLPNGDISWSDYGLKPLWNIINEYNDNMSAEEVLVLVNRALDVTHWNGDLSSAFIIGGAKTLSKISNESINKKGKIINESVEDKILYIIRGVPGSGKSTLAHKLTDNVVEADQYFYDNKGNYNWSADKLNQAHNWCFYTVKKYMEEGRNKIAVANTFVKNRDYKRYVELAKEFGYKVDIRTCTGNYQNIHNVPDETVEKMRSKFQETPLDESVKLVNKEVTDTKLVTTPSELNEIIKNHPQSRIVYDKAKKWFLIGDGEVSIHTYLINDALLDGYYEPFEYKGRMVTGNRHDYEDGAILYDLNPGRFVLFRTSKDPNDREDYYYDNYQYCYIYKDYCVFDRNGDFKRTPLYKFLGEPMNIDIFGVINDEIHNGSKEELDESVKFINAENVPTKFTSSVYEMKRYIENNKNIRIVYDTENKWYFFNNSNEEVHAQILDDAISAGYYPNETADGDEILFGGNNGEFITLLIESNINIKNAELDGYAYGYVYNDFIIYDRYGDYRFMELCKVLGKPNKILDLEDEIYGKNDLDESAENDKILRDYATELANICLDALVKAKYETRISKGQVQINVDKAFKKAVPMLKNSPYEYFLLLVSEKDEPNPSFGKANDNKYGVIMFPIFSSDPSDLGLSILYKHKSVLEKLYTTYSGDELKLKIHEYAVKYLKNEIKKRLENKKNTYLGLLIHECTHLLDDVRRTKTYKSKEQNLKDDKGIKDYFNSPEEQNAFYQETVSIFDKWANQSVGYKTFDIFWDDFIRQYRGEYNILNDKNKRKLKKRAYAYWYVYMKD